MIQSTSSSKVPTTQIDSSKIKDVLVTFYTEFNAEKVSSIDSIMSKYIGNELELLRNLKDKYEVVSYEPFDKLLQEYSQKASTQPSPDTIDLSQSTKTKIDGSVPSISTFPNLTIGIKDISTVSSSLAGRILSGVNTWRNSLDQSNGQNGESKTDGLDAINYMQKRVDELKEEIQALELERNRLELLVLGRSTDVQQVR
jgi:hypothetical protein